MAFNINQNPNQEKTAVPPPPVPEVAVRTMQSDIKSINTGEIKPSPEIISAPSGPTAPEPSFIPETDNKMGGVVAGAGAKKSKRALWGIIAVVVIAGLAAVGYFVIYPLITGGDASPVTQNPPAVNQPDQTPETAPAQQTTHLSAFVSQPVKTEVVSLGENLNQTAITEAIISNSDLAEVNTLTELVFTDGRSAQISFPIFIGAYLPEFDGTASAGDLFGDDFTAYFYKDENGVWPGFVVKLNADAQAADLAAWLTAMEATDLSQFFVTAPGTFAEFKDGTLNNIPDRYAVGSSKGASFGYATANGQLIIATSYNGMKEAFRLLGL